MAQFVGLAVSLDCGDTLGVYQGVVAGVDNALQTISIENAFQNGIRCPHPMVTIRY
jgi:enhancer of mRNA-decapping protein 3